MRLLLDTQVLLWWLADDPALGSTVRAAVANPENLVMASAAGAWKIGVKRALGKLDAPDDLEHQVQANGFAELSFTELPARGRVRSCW